MTRRLWLLAAMLLPLTSAAFAQDQADLAKATQNQVAAMISLPFQNNTLFGIGPNDDTAKFLNIQPVIPFTVSDWYIVNRTIVPLIYLPELTSGPPELPEDVSGGSTFGLGDIVQTEDGNPGGDPQKISSTTEDADTPDTVDPSLWRRSGDVTIDGDKAKLEELVALSTALSSGSTS